MNTGSIDERQYLADVHRIAQATEKIAEALQPKAKPADEDDPTYDALADIANEVAAYKQHYATDAAHFALNRISRIIDAVVDARS